MLSGALAEGYRQLLFWLGRQPAFSWLGPRLFTPVDTWLYPRTHGALASTGPSVLPLLLLTSVGRFSGQPRSVPLVYLRDGQRILVVASNWGRRQHPAWSENLLASPAATIQIGAQYVSVCARLVTSEEKAELWPRLRGLCPVWQTYAERSGRELRVFALELSGGSARAPYNPGTLQGGSDGCHPCKPVG